MQKFELIDNDTLINQTCLFNEKPIVLNRGLAIIFGDADTALLFQQLHYWINLNKEYAQSNKRNIETYHNGRFWCFQTYEEWNKEFSWISYNSVRRKIKKLEELGVVISGNFNKLNLDRTKWYTIDYQKLLELQNRTLHKKLKEKDEKEKIRKEKKKKIAQKIKETKSKNSTDKSVDNNNNSSNFRSAHFGHLPSAQNEHLEVPKMGAPIQEINIQEINNIQDINIVSQSVVDNQNLKKEMTDGQTDYTQNFKIEIENNDNELNNLVVDIANDLLTSQKTITVNNKKIRINGLITELKKLDKNNLVKLIEYVSKKFENNNSDNIKNKNKYIVSIFANAVFEKGYLLNDFKNNNHSINTNKQYGKNKFVNYKQEPFDYDLLRQIELQSLKGLLD